MSKRILAAALCYLVPTFMLGFFWHLVWFKGYYDALAMYRKDVIIPFGLLSMSIQALLFAWLYERSFARREGPLLARALAYALFGAALSWSFTTIAVAAKNVMSSVRGYLFIESSFTAVQWLLVAPLTAVVLAGPARSSTPIARSNRYLVAERRPGE
ncbi:MAG TPA: hypothetical protein VGQ57_11035 [Polyangiaceae bacterium]|nr:hypothetical protein [Polyangiaceae bacterium]